MTYQNYLKHNALTLLAPISQNGQTLKQFVGNLPTKCLSVFDHFVGLALNGLTHWASKPFLYDIVFFGGQHQYVYDFLIWDGYA